MSDKRCCHCGCVSDLRPYGPGGAWVCFPCATTPENKPLTRAMFGAQLDACERHSDVALLTDAGPVPVGGTRDA